MNKAIFLDRDGVINFEQGYTYKLEEFKILPDVFETLRWWRQQGFMLIVITNQSGIAKGLYKQEDVEMIHEFMVEEMRKNDIVLDEIFYCKHHPDVSKCICRKPDSLFVEKAIARFNIDPSKSFFIGDKERDIEAGQKGGLTGILINSNTSLTLLREQIGNG